MTASTSARADAGTRLAGELASFGPVHLDVVDRDRSLAFWRDVIGLRQRDDGDALALGTETDTLLVLHPGATRPAGRGHSGLYHVAIHPPDEPEFARVLARLIAHGWPIAPTDHVMSKSIYLSDVDGLGLELTLETPERMRELRFTDAAVEIIDADGNSRSGLDPLDVPALLATLPDRDITRPLPVGTKVGHVHLHVADLESAMAFYRDGLEFIEGMYAPTMGIADLHAGGRFQHRMAINVWQGVGAPPPPAGMAGLRHVTIRYDTPARLSAVLQRLLGGERREDGVLVRDPAGNALLLTGPAADIDR